MRISRFFLPEPGIKDIDEQEKCAFALTDTLGTTAEIPFTEFAGGRIYIPAGSSITALTFWDAPVPGGTFLPSYDDAATPAALAWTGLTAGRSYLIPPKLFAAGAIKIVVNTAGTVYISRKS